MHIVDVPVAEPARADSVAHDIVLARFFAYQGPAWFGPLRDPRHIVWAFLSGVYGSNEVDPGIWKRVLLSDQAAPV